MDECCQVCGSHEDPFNEGFWDCGTCFDEPNNCTNECLRRAVLNAEMLSHQASSELEAMKLRLGRLEAEIAEIRGGATCQTVTGV